MVEEAGGWSWKKLKASDMLTQEVLASGGSGDVTRILYKGMVMARKRIRAASRAKSRHLTRFLVHEVRIMAAVRHPNLCRFLGVCIEPGEQSILMEFASLGSLRDVLDKDPLLCAWRRFQLLFGVVNGLRKLHAHTPRPIIHHDLKSLNVLVTEDPSTGAWVAKIADFGLATGGFSTESSSQHKGGGTPTHLPPEVIDGGTFTTAGDVYSLGIVVWECITSNDPFEGMKSVTISRTVVDKQRRPLLSATPAPGSVFSAEQWRFLAGELISGGGEDGAQPRGCWAQDPASRPSLRAVAQSFQAAAHAFAPPERENAALEKLLADYRTQEPSTVAAAGAAAPPNR